VTDFAEGSETAAELAPRPVWQHRQCGPCLTDWHTPLPNCPRCGGPFSEPPRTTTFDPVIRPAHYASGAIECIDAIKVALQGETDPFVAYLRGQVMKYTWRTGKKDDAVQDLEKAAFYLERAIAEKRRGAADA